MPLEIAQKPLKEKKSLIQQESPHVYQSLRKMLAQNDLHSLFAEPVKTADGKNMIWFTHLAGELQSFDALTPEAQHEARMMLSQQVATIQKVAGEYGDAGLSELIDTIFTIPSEDDIYIIDQNGTKTVVLTQWGYVLDNPNADTDILRKMLVIPTHTVSFLVVYEDDTPVSDISFQSKIIYQNKPQTEIHQTDSAGKFAVEVPDGGQLEVAEQKNRYQHTWTIYQKREVKITLPYPAQDMRFEVQDTTGKTVADSTWVFEYEGQNINHTSDAQGKIILPSVPFGASVAVFQGEKKHLQQYLCTEGQDKYIIVLPTEAKQGMIFKALYGKKPLEGAMLSLAYLPTGVGGRQEENLPTNANGVYLWENVPLGTKVKAIASKKLREKDKKPRIRTKTFTLKKLEDVHTLQFKRNRWWLLLLLLLFFIPIPLLLNVTVFDAYKEKPIIQPQSPIVVLTKGSESEDKKTDKEGIAAFGWRWMFLFEFVFPIHEYRATSSCDCFQEGQSKGSLYTLPKKHLLKLRGQTLNPIVISEDDREPLPDAKVVVEASYPELWKETKNFETDIEGKIKWKDVPACATFRIIASKEGYHNDTLKVGKLRDLKNDTLRLKPKMGKVTFAVKNKKNLQPLPNATVILYDATGKERQRGRTNVNGNVALVEFGVRIIDSGKNIKIWGEKEGFYPDSLKNTVGYFLKADLKQRTLYLQPKSVDLSFNIRDKKTGKPLPNARVVLECGGKTWTEPTNSNGDVTFADVPDDCEPKIVAGKDGYQDGQKKGKIKDFENPEERIIELEPDNKPKPPTDNCRVFVTGLHVGGSKSGGKSEAYIIDTYSEYVGSGEYPENTKAFPKAVATTFDGIAIAKGTRVIIYSQPNFGGEVVLDRVGPLMVNNKKFEKDYANFLTETFPANLQALFPPNTREWSKSDMHAWSFGSMKVICNE